MSENKRGYSLRPMIVFVAAWLGGSWLVVGAWLRPLLPGGWFGVAAGIALLAIVGTRSFRRLSARRA